MPSSTFDAAAAYTSNAPSLNKVSNALKLELYGLFKTVTVGLNPTTSRPSIFDVTGRAKWDAWSRIGREYPDTECAEARYLELAKELGWDGTEQPRISETNKEKGKASDKGDEDIWDSEESFSKVGGGFGFSVSTLAHTKEASERSIHGFAVENETREIEELLAQTPDLNLNKLDEHGYTPLHLAADRGHLDVVKLLLSKGVDKSIKDPDDMTAIDLARVVGYKEIISVLSE